MIFYALSVRQPWADAILFLKKDIENRSWKCPVKYLNRPILLHTGFYVEKNMLESCSLLSGLKGASFLTGGIVGHFVITSGNVTGHESKWADPLQYNWELSQVGRLHQIYPCKGRLGFFPVNLPDEFIPAALRAA